MQQLKNIQVQKITFLLHTINKNVKPQVLQIHLGQAVLLMKQKPMRLEPWNKNTQVSTMVQHIRVLVVGHCSDGTANTASLCWILIRYSTINLVSQEQCLRGFLVLSYRLVCSNRHAKDLSMHYSRVKTTSQKC